MFADDAAGFAEDEFDEAGIFASAVVVGGGGDIEGASGRGDCCQVDQAVFGFGDDFLSEDEDVVLMEGEFGFSGGGDEDAWEVVVWADFGDVGDGEELDWAGVGHEAWRWGGREMYHRESREHRARAEKKGARRLAVPLHCFECVARD